MVVSLRESDAEAAAVSIGARSARAVKHLSANQAADARSMLIAAASAFALSEDATIQNRCEAQS